MNQASLRCLLQGQLDKASSSRIAPHQCVAHERTAVKMAQEFLSWAIFAFSGKSHISNAIRHAYDEAGLRYEVGVCPFGLEGLLVPAVNALLDHDDQTG